MQSMNKELKIRPADAIKKIENIASLIFLTIGLKKELLGEGGRAKLDNLIMPKNSKISSVFCNILHKNPARSFDSTKPLLYTPAKVPP